MSSELIWLSAVELLEGYGKGEFSPVEVTAGGARPDRRQRRSAQRVQSGRRRACAGRGEGERGALAESGAPGPGRRRADRGQGSYPDRGLADDARLKDHRPGPALERGRAVGGAHARAWRRLHRQDHDARIRLEGGDRQYAYRHHAQSLGRLQDTWGLERRVVGGGRRRHVTAFLRHGWRRLDPHPRGLRRHLRHQAELRPGAGLSHEPVRHGRPCRPDDPHGRGFRPDADRDGGT